MIGSVVVWLLWAVIGFASVKAAAVAVEARRRQKYRRCLTRIERLEVELGYRKAPATWSGLLSDMVYGPPGRMVELRPGASMPTYFAPHGTVFSSVRRQWTDDEIERRHIDQGGTPLAGALHTSDRPRSLPSTPSNTNQEAL